MILEACAIVRDILDDEAIGVNAMLAQLQIRFGERPPFDVKHILSSTEDADLSLILADPPALLVAPDLPPEMEPLVPGGARAADIRIVIGYAAPSTMFGGSDGRKNALHTIRAARVSLARAFVDPQGERLRTYMGVTIVSPSRFVEMPSDSTLVGAENIEIGAALFADFDARDSFEGGS